MIETILNYGITAAKMDIKYNIYKIRRKGTTLWTIIQ
jgi:hypothetical protein